jgi:hypothetical protein
VVIWYIIPVLVFCTKKSGTSAHHPLTIEILGLQGESTNEKWTIFLGYQGKFIMVLPSAARLGRLLLKKNLIV